MHVECAESEASGNFANSVASEIYKIYKWLCTETKINGIKGIEKYKKNEYGKLWREHNLYPKIVDLKAKLRALHLEKIRPKMLKYEILK